MDPETRETCSANLQEDFDKILACGALDYAKQCQDMSRLCTLYSAAANGPFSRSCNEDDWSDLLSAGRLPANAVAGARSSQQQQSSKVLAIAVQGAIVPEAAAHGLGLIFPSAHALPVDGHGDANLQAKAEV